MEYLNRGCYPAEICGCGRQKKTTSNSELDGQKKNTTVTALWLGWSAKKKAPITLSSVGKNNHHSYGQLTSQDTNS